MMSEGLIGVLIAPMKFLRQRIPAITGNDPSVAPFCMPEAAINPVATKAR